jgi:hypothetical protein
MHEVIIHQHERDGLTTWLNYNTENMIKMHIKHRKQVEAQRISEKDTTKGEDEIQ